MGNGDILSLRSTTPWSGGGGRKTFRWLSKRYIGWWFGHITQVGKPYLVLDCILIYVYEQ